MSAPDDHAPTRSRRRLRLRKPTWRGWFTIGLIVVVIALVTAWAIEYGTLGDRVARNVTVEDVSLSRLSGAELSAAFDRADSEYGKGTVEFIINGKSHPMSAGDIGLHLDTGATLAAARNVARNDPTPLRPFKWLVSWFQPRRVPVTVRLDRAKLAEALATLPNQTPVVEPRVVGSVDAIGTTPGEPGYGFDPTRVARRIESAARDGTLPLRVPLVAETIEPVVADAEVSVLAARARKLTDRTMELSIPGETMTATPPMLRSWITSVLPPGAIHAKLAMDPVQLLSSVRQQLGIIVTKSKGATFTVEGSQVLLVPQVDGLRCCSLASGDKVMKALDAGEPSLALPLAKHPPTMTTAKARKLGITTLLGTGRPTQPQQIWHPDDTAPPPAAPPPNPTDGNSSTTSTTTSSTTTTLPARTGAGTGQFIVPIPNLQGQATNVKRVIPLLRGRIILPGEKLSLNAVVGPPSPDRKFVPARVATADGPTWISGGGTDLVAAALFEAAYESGLDIPTSTRHRVLPEGVRPGIEATLGWTGPDLVIANPSDHAILVWADQAANGVRIQLFGTPFTKRVTTDDSRLPFGPGRSCTAVNVERTRVFTDGRTKTDTFAARYTPPPAARDDPARVICRG